MINHQRRITLSLRSSCCIIQLREKEKRIISYIMRSVVRDMWRPLTSKILKDSLSKRLYSILKFNFKKKIFPW